MLSDLNKESIEILLNENTYNERNAEQQSCCDFKSSSSLHRGFESGQAVDLRLVDLFQMSQKVPLLVVLVAAVRTVEGESLVVDLLQVVVEVDLVGVLLATAVADELLQALVNDLNVAK